MERTIFLSGFKANAPEEFFNQVLAVIRAEMSTTNFDAMVASLAPGQGTLLSKSFNNYLPS